MRTFLECIPCFFMQTLKTARLSTTDERVIKELLDEIGLCIKDIPLTNTPPETGAMIYTKIKEFTKNVDPYKEIKRTHINEALSLYDEMSERIKNSRDPLLTAIRMAIAGNVIDLGVNKKFNLKNDIETILRQEFGIFHYEQFKTQLKKAKNILYLGDNAGESVFDRLLITQLKKRVTYAVRGSAIINDCTYQDAIHSGIDEVATIISSGSHAPATILKFCKDEFIEIFNAADMIISKGQGNFEGLSEVNKPIFFLLKAKCPVIASHLNVKEDDIILKSRLNEY